MSKVTVIISVSAAEQDLAACLASVRDVAGEIVVSDITGQKSVAEITRSFCATYVDASASGTIAEARNVALKRVQSDWVLVLDADERLEPQDAVAFSTHVCAESVDVYSVSVRRYVDSIQSRTWEASARPNPICVSEELDSFPAYLQTVEPRLFQRSKVRHFEETAAEAVEIAFDDGLIRECRASLRVHRLPANSERMHELRRASGRRRIEAEPHNAIAHFRLGVLEFEDFADYDMALVHFRSACIANGSFGPAWLFTGMCLVKLGDYQRAQEACLRAEICGLHVPMVAEIMGEALYREGDYAGARASLIRALRRAEKSQPHCTTAIARKLEMAEWRLKGATSPFQQRILDEETRLIAMEATNRGVTLSTKSKEQSEAALLSMNLLQ